MKVIDKLYVVMYQKYDHLLHNPIVAFFSREEAVDFINDLLKHDVFEYVEGGDINHKNEYWYAFHKRCWIRETNLAKLEDDEPYEGDEW